MSAIISKTTGTINLYNYFQVPVINIPMRIVVIFLTSPGLFLQIYRLYVLIFRQGGKGKNGSTVAVSNHLLSIYTSNIL